MLFTKEYLTGRNIDLSKYNLGIIRQIRVDEFMNGYDYDLIDFVKPFYLEQSLDLNKDISENQVHFTYFYLLSQEDDKILQELIKSLIFLYQLDDTKDNNGNYENIILFSTDDRLVLILKKDGEPFAFIDDSNFNILSQVMLEMCYFDKPEPEPETKGDPELIEKMKKRRMEYEKKHNKKKSIQFEEIVRQVMYARGLIYNDIKNWTIWQVKDVHVVECLKESSDKSYLLATNPYSGMNLKEVKNWKYETKLTRE
ncbi:hypothetical protein [Terrisporobacter sp.]|uniref:hypothetical protein n=1 Tax=Terrisporobacter sp. TaxID=1965305 RepID=UPI002899F059|nr:hypothetical protein [Terrisporobacter sp.]